MNHSTRLHSTTFIKLKSDFIQILDIVIKKDLHKCNIKFTLIRYEVANRIKNFYHIKSNREIILIHYLGLHLQDSG